MDKKVFSFTVFFLLSFLGPIWSQAQTVEDSEKTYLQPSQILVTKEKMYATFPEEEHPFEIRSLFWDNNGLYAYRDSYLHCPVGLLVEDSIECG